MEVKENNIAGSAQSQLNFAKFAGFSFAKTGSFADLLGAVEATNAKADIVPPARDVKPEKKWNPDAKASSAKEIRESKKADAKREAPAVKKEDAKANVEKKEEDEVENFAASQGVAGAAEEKSVEEEKTASVPGEGDEAVAADSDGVQAQLVTEMISAVSGAGMPVEEVVVEAVAAPQAVLPEADSMEGAGEEVAPALQTNNQDVIAAEEVVPEIDLAEVQTVETAETAQELDAFNPVGEAVETDSDYLAGNVEKKIAAPELVGQAKEIAKAVGENRKMEVNVSVKNDEPLRFSARDLLAGAPIVFEEAAAVTTEVEAKNTQPAFAEQSPFQPQSPSRIQTQAQPQPQQAAQMDFNFNAGIAPVAGQGLVGSPAASDASENQMAVSLNTAQGNEVAANARAQNADRVSFKDVYKGLGKEVVEQVKVNITKSAVKGIDKIDIQLKPRDLGDVEVKIQIAKDGKLQAHVVASRAETMEILQRDAGTLEKALADAGFEADSGSLSFGLKEEQSNRNNENLREFIGRALEEQGLEADNSNLAFDNAWDGKSALNIRV